MNNHNPVIVAEPGDAELPHRSTGLALAEGIAMLGLLALLDYSRVLPFSIWPVHPFMFAVILLSAQYGIQGGLMAALGATVLSHLDGWPDRPIDMAYAEYFLTAWADSLSWVLAALTVGILTSYRARMLREQTIKLQKATLAQNLIAAQYQVLAQRTHRLERSLAGRTTEVSAEPEVLLARETGGKAPKRSRAARQSHSWGASRAPATGPGQATTMPNP
jgi:hypothetical protein